MPIDCPIDALESWVWERGQEGALVRSSLLRWTDAQPGGVDQQIEAIHALLGMAEALALGLPERNDKIAEAFYAAADEITTNAPGG